MELYADKQPIVLAVICQPLDANPETVRELFDSCTDKFDSRVGEWRQAELAFAYDGKKARLLGQSIARKYEEHGATQKDVCCSLDLVYRDKEDPQVWVVADYKTGHGDVDLPGENHQVRFGCLCVLDWLLEQGEKPKAIRGEIWKVRSDRTWVDEHTFNVFDLQAYRQELASIQQRIPFAPAVSGDHCRYCPANGSCPATTESLGKLVELPDEFIWSASIKNEQHAALMAERVGALRQSVDNIYMALKEYARTHCGGMIPVGNGKVYREIETNRSSLNQAALKAALGEDELKKYMCKAKVMQWRITKIPKS